MAHVPRINAYQTGSEGRGFCIYDKLAQRYYSTEFPTFTKTFLVAESTSNPQVATSVLGFLLAEKSMWKRCSALPEIFYQHRPMVFQSVSEGEDK